uniref:Dynein light chain Tctex-type 1 n=1 Tax=Schistocephalus solidus TaxID=70667 RepID=A0A0X3PQ82_SCHSO
MDGLETSEETTFIVDEVANIVKENIENTVGSSTYVHSKVNQWTSTIIEQVLNQLTKLGKPFKYIGNIQVLLSNSMLVTCVIMQKCGAGLHTASSCYWDNTTDGSCTVRWENKSMYFIVTVFGLAI